MATPTRRRATTTRRRQAPRRRTARSRRHDALAVVAVVGLFAVIAAARWVNQHRGISVAVGTVAALAGLYWVTRIAGRRIVAYRSRWAVPTGLAAYMAADPDQFEQQTAALCRRDGCRDIRVVGGAGDLAADVLATTPGGKKILIQCKRYATHNKVGSDHVQRVNGTYRDIHGCTQAAIVTTSSYTPAAISLARRVNIRLYDARDLERWARGGQPPW
jgi:restriction system protein